MYISVTGLKLHSRWQMPGFMVHAVRSMTEAQRADGNLFADARTVNSGHHTLTAWQDRAAMVAYLGQPHHRAAMRAFPTLGHGRTLGYEAEELPSWKEALALWREHAREARRPARA